MPRFEEKVGARLRRDPSDLASYYSCSFIKRDSGGNSNSILLPSPSSQNGYSRATAFRTSPFTRVNGSRVLEFIRSIKIEANGSLSRAKEKHIYIYTSGTRIYSWWVPVQIVTSLTVLLVLPIRISSPSLSPYSDIFARVRICEPDDMS